MAAVIRDNGARGAVQFNHAGRYNFSFFLDGRQAVAPSPIASRMTRDVPREHTEGEIRQIIQALASAAGRVIEARPAAWPKGGGSTGRR